MRSKCTKLKSSVKHNDYNWYVIKLCIYDMHYFTYDMTIYNLNNKYARRFIYKGMNSEYVDKTLEILLSIVLSWSMKCKIL